MAQIFKENCLWAIKFVSNHLCAILNYPKKIPIFLKVNINEFVNIFQILLLFAAPSRPAAPPPTPPFAPH